MKKRLLFIFIVSAAAWLTAAWLQKSISPTANLRYYANQLEETIHQREQLALELVNGGPLDRWLRSPASLETITTLPLFIFRNDSLVAYTDHRIPITERLSIEGTCEIQALRDGVYLCYKNRQYHDGSFYDIIGAIPLYRNYPLDNEQLTPHFPLMTALPAGVTWNEKAGTAPIHRRDGKLLGYLNSEDQLLLPGRALLLNILIITGMFGLFLSTVLLALRLTKRAENFWGILWIPGCFFTLGYLMPLIFPVPPPGLLECFYVPVGLFRTGDFLILALALYGCWWFAYQRPIKMPAFFLNSSTFFQVTVHYILAGTPLILIAFLIRYGVGNSLESLDFVNFFNLPPEGYLLVVAVLLSTIPLSIFSQLIVLRVRQMAVDDRHRLFASGIGLLPLMLSALWLDLALLPTLLSGMIYIALLDLFADYHRPSLTWLVIWLVFFSALCTVLFFKYHIERELQQMARQAQALTTESVPEQSGRQDKKIPRELQASLAIPGGEVSKAMINPMATTTRFDYVLFREGNRIEQQGTPNLSWHNSTLPPGPGQIKKRLTSSRIDLLYQHPEGETVLIGKKLGGYATPLALFSFLFVLLLVLLMLFSAGQYFLGQRREFYWGEFGHPSLRYRIQLSFIALIIGAFVLIGMVTASSFKRSAIQQYGNRLSEKLNALVADLQIQLGEPPYTEAAVLAEKLSRIHRTDLAVFDERGMLLGASPSYLFQTGLFPSRMSIAAQRSLSNGTQNLRLQTEKTGQLEYRMAYIPVSTGKEGIPKYLGVPFPTRAGTLGPDMYAFIGTLINVYVFLLLAASALTIAVANSITQPLDRLGAKLQSIQLGYNEPLEWQSNDEIGQLIQAYNEMIAKLEAATEELRQSEREGAWREMAKQVAHEIKNPLTPMKLSLQHLQRAYRSNPEQASELIDRVGQTLIEQINSLTRIAGAFSDFAKMPQAQHESILLNDLLQSAFLLFRNEFSREAGFELQLPDEPLKVQADRSHLLRVLNNLLTNGLQAIPAGRAPLISLQLQREGKKALIRVRDNGSGIPVAMRERVFYPNFTTKSSGMGLGLAMCKNIIEQAGGHIYFETVTDQGTTFFVELPLETTKNPPALKEPED